VAGVTFMYELWGRCDGSEWYSLGPEHVEAGKVHHWNVLPPLPGRWEFAHTVLAGGCPEEFWRVRIGVRQRLSDVVDGWTTQGSRATLC
jgi:hypothetical protein